MNSYGIAFGVLCVLFLVLAYSLISKLKNKTKITFQTSCAVQFILMKPQANSASSNKPSYFKFVPELREYLASDLAQVMNSQAAVAQFPLSVSFTNGRFILACTDTQTEDQGIQVTDREYTDADGATPPPQGPVYQGAQYGEATRFLNHLLIHLETTYLPYNIIGDFFNPGSPAISTQSILDYHIGTIAVPLPPVSCTGTANADYQFTITFPAAPAGCVTGIYLQQNVLDTDTLTLDQLDATGWNGTLVFTKEDETQYIALPDGPIINLVGSTWSLVYNGSNDYYTSLNLIDWEVGTEGSSPAPVGTFTPPGNVENWDITPDNTTTSYTFLNLQKGIYYKAAITVVGLYDESTLFYQTPTPTLITGADTPLVFQVIGDSNRDDKNKLEINSSIFNTYEIATQDLDTLPDGTLQPALTRRDQIISISIKFYLNISSSFTIYFPPTYPSDSRIEIERGGTEDGTGEAQYIIFDYMYWKRVIPDAGAATQFSDVFASTDFPGTNFGGAPLPWATAIITSPEVLDAIFPHDPETKILNSTFTPNLRLFIGYTSNQLVTDATIRAIQSYSIEYNA